MDRIVVDGIIYVSKQEAAQILDVEEEWIDDMPGFKHRKMSVKRQGIKYYSLDRCFKIKHG